MPALVIAALLVVFMVGPCHAAEPLKLVVFGFAIHDTSGEPVSADRAARLSAITKTLAAELAATGRFEVLAPTPGSERIPALHTEDGCDDCDAAEARAMGANVYASGLVIKVSSQVLNLRLWLQDARTLKVKAQAIAEIRGDNEASWQRGIRWLVRNRIVPAVDAP